MVKKNRWLLIGGGAAALVVITIILLLHFWLPRKMAAAINERFGKYVKVGEIHYVFPLGAEARDLTLIRGDKGLISGEARRVRARLRLSSLLLLRFDGRLFESVETSEFTLYFYKPELKKPNIPIPGLRPPRGSAPPAFNLAPTAASIVYPSGGAAVTKALTPPEKPNNPPANGPRLPKKNPAGEFDFTFAASGGRVILREPNKDTLLLKGVQLNGRATAHMYKGSLKGSAPDEGSFEISFQHDRETKTGYADYKVEAVKVVHVLGLAARPGYLLEAEGRLTFTGHLTWKDKEIDHRATGRLEDGRLVLQPGEFRFILDDVTLQFTLHNADVRIDEGTCRAAEAGWHFEGLAGQFNMDLVFRSENMTLQKLVDMFTGEVKISYAGIGVATFRISGPPQDPEFYLKIERSDK